ncbi:DUF4367 domain-containing protein [Fredinandcohnia quinoae]|uniref:DUF4367 domain-containing protein n=1 Tax=Fredinandcohnia quinoae TaxID=2918902 RepID=A0AAW5E738_9BACI|nr:DUF4367 domain-containing protein [Fredinandcohnia sp. SECRCQ15]MCH1627050.1 DUF4367 domain-containing protein [Fredinandcohnia sp. SECRCQ15]
MGDKYRHVLDQIIEETVKEEYDHILPITSTNEAWENFNKRREHKYKSRTFSPRKKKFVMLGTSLAVCIILISLLPQSGSSFASLTEIFGKVEGNMISLFVKVGENEEHIEDVKEPSLDEYYVIEGSETTMDEIDLEQAKKETAFPILIPKWVPTDFELEHVLVLTKQNQKSDEIYLQYKSNAKHFTIRQTSTGHEFGLGMSYNKDEVNVEQIKINGYQANLINRSKGISKLFWVTQSIYYSIDGHLTKEEIIQIAESM